MYGNTIEEEKRFSEKEDRAYARFYCNRMADYLSSEQAEKLYLRLKHRAETRDKHGVKETLKRIRKWYNSILKTAQVN